MRIALALFVVVLAGCKGDKKPAPASSAGSTAAQPAGSDPAAPGAVPGGAAVGPEGTATSDGGVDVTGDGGAGSAASMTKEDFDRLRPKRLESEDAPKTTREQDAAKLKKNRARTDVEVVPDAKK